MNDDEPVPLHIQELFKVNLPPEFEADIYLGASTGKWRLNIRYKGRGPQVAYVYEDGIHLIDKARNAGFSTQDSVPLLLRQIEALLWLGELK